jgi:oleate hydratase
MPRKIADRPKVIPEDCANPAFIGRLVGWPGDVVFTVEPLVRRAMMAVWGLSGLDTPMVPIHAPVFDLRVIVSFLNATLDIAEMTPQNPAGVAASSPPGTELLFFLNGWPKPIF